MEFTGFMDLRAIAMTFVVIQILKSGIYNIWPNGIIHLGWFSIKKKRVINFVAILAAFGSAMGWYYYDNADPMIGKALWMGFVNFLVTVGIYQGVFKGLLPDGIQKLVEPKKEDAAGA